MINNRIFIAIFLIILTFTVYINSYAGEGKDWNYFVVLADAFLHDRLDIVGNMPWLNELAKFEGKNYVVFPPMPAILLVPFVYFFGVSFPQPYLSILLGSFSVGLCYLVLSKKFSAKVALWGSLLFGFGTIHWYHAEVGSAWYLAHITGIFFLWLLLLETLGKGRLFLIGIFIGAAYLCRIPMVLAAFFPFVYFLTNLISFTNKRLKVNFKSLFLLGLGILPALALNGLYNFVRFGVPYDISYTLLPIFDEPWYKYGFVSIKYIPIHLKEMLFGLPVFSNTYPFIYPNLFAMSIILVTPAFFLIFRARIKERIVLAALVSTVAIMIPELMHGGNGFTQFGYRHTLDVLPFMMIMVASGIREKVSWWIKMLIILSILINLWGVVMVSQLGLWKMAV